MIRPCMIRTEHLLLPSFHSVGGETERDCGEMERQNTGEKDYHWFSLISLK
jgi:hypothetical protein